VSYTPMPATTLAPTLLPNGAPPPTSLRTIVPVTMDMVTQCTRHVFEGRFTPLKLVVNGRKGRRVIVVLGSDRKHYRVLDMDFRKGGGQVDGEGDSDEETEAMEDEDEDVEMGGA
jgi:anaphase-promoting complex subunit 4